MHLLRQIDRAARRSPWASRDPADVVVMLTAGLAAVLVDPSLPRSLAAVGLATGLAVGPVRAPWRLWLTMMALPLGFVVLSIAPLAVWTVVLHGSGSEVLTLTAMAGLVARSVAASSLVALVGVSMPITTLAHAARRVGVSPDLVAIGLSTHRFVHRVVDLGRGLVVGDRMRFGAGGLRPPVRLGLAAASLVRRTAGAVRGTERGLAARGFASVPLVPPDVRPASAGFCLLVVVAALVVWLLLPGEARVR
jgi:hypothetical protein